MGLGNSGFYFSRHLLPYDSGLSCAHLSLIYATGAPSRGALHAAWAGVWCGATFHLYNGYWYLVPVLGLLFLVLQRGQTNRVLPANAFAAGAIGRLILPLFVGVWAIGSDYLTIMRAFGRTAAFGSFADGATFPWEYLWHAESAFDLVVVALWSRHWRQAGAALCGARRFT